MIDDAGQLCLGAEPMCPIDEQSYSSVLITITGTKLVSLKIQYRGSGPRKEFCKEEKIVTRPLSSSRPIGNLPSILPGIAICETVTHDTKSMILIERKMVSLYNIYFAPTLTAR